MLYFFLLLAKPTISEGNENVTVVLPEGGDYSMTCTGYGVPAPKMIWFMNGSPISHYNGKYIVVYIIHFFFKSVQNTISDD